MIRSAHRHRRRGTFGSAARSRLASAASTCVLWLAVRAPAVPGAANGGPAPEPGHAVCARGEPESQPPSSEPACGAGGPPVPAPRPSAGEWRTHARPVDRFLDVLTLNTALLPEPVSYTSPTVRAAVMAPYLAGCDVLVLQEALVVGWRDAVLAELADAYPYRGEVVGRAGSGGLPWRQDGAIVILSRWPVVRQTALTFGAACSGTDCLADEGAAYVTVRKGDRTYHVFATHARSSFGLDAAAVRAERFELMAGFVAAPVIPRDEVVLLAGDLDLSDHYAVWAMVALPHATVVAPEVLAFDCVVLGAP